MGGSFAKDTWLKDEADIDIFLEFPSTLSKDELKKYGLEIALESMAEYAPILRYAEHPYVEASFKGVTINIVPCFKVKKGEWKSAADRSPYHTKFMSEALNDELRNEIRLLKKFMKNVGVYGAEIEIQGFSGYVCEVLCLKYSSFISTLKAALKWRKREIISLEMNNIDDILLQKKFKDCSILIFDPVDIGRNLGTAISPKRIAEFMFASRAFLKKPRISFFLNKKRNLDKLEINDLVKNIVILKFKHTKRSRDILWGQLKRSLKHILKQLKLYNFEIIRATCASDNEQESAFIFLMENLNLSKFEKKEGPEVFRFADSKKFIVKNRQSKMIWIDEDAKLSIFKDRKIKNLHDFFDFFLQKRKGEGISSGLLNDVIGSYEVYIDLENSKFLLKPWLSKKIVTMINSDRFLNN